jgi:hypothetical protein
MFTRRVTPVMSALRDSASKSARNIVLRRGLVGGRAKRRRNKDRLREKAMFHRRSSEFEPRISAITEHLRGIQMPSRTGKSA